MSIIAPLPYNIANGDPIDATPVMANYNQIRTNVNSNAADVNAQNTFTQPQNGVNAILGAQFVTLAQVQALLLNSQPIGSILAMATGGVPAGYLWCNGAAVSRTTYALLFAVIGTQWGAGDGVSTFNLPNFINTSLVGAGGSFAVAGQYGASTHSLSVAEMPSHNHGVNDPTHVHPDPGHGHGFNDPGHAHGISDPGHGHSQAYPAFTGITVSSGPFGNLTSGGNAGASTGGAGTGIGINGAFTGASVAGATCGLFATATNISIQFNGSNAAFGLYHPVSGIIYLIRNGL